MLAAANRKALKDKLLDSAGRALGYQLALPLISNARICFRNHVVTTSAQRFAQELLGEKMKVDVAPIGQQDDDEIIVRKYGQQASVPEQKAILPCQPSTPPICYQPTQSRTFGVSQAFQSAGRHLGRQRQLDELGRNEPTVEKGPNPMIQTAGRPHDPTGSGRREQRLDELITGQFDELVVPKPETIF